MLSQFQAQRTMSGLEYANACAPLCRRECLKCRVYVPMGGSFCLFVLFLFLACTSGGVYVPCIYLHACQVKVTVGDSGICFCACVRSLER